VTVSRPSSPLQRWEGDRIAAERFVYDSASAWTVVEKPGQPI